MLKRQRTGSVVCTSCGVLVGVNDDRCYNCNRRNPGLWGFAPALRSLGADLGFVPFVLGLSAVVYVLTGIYSIREVGPSGLLSPTGRALLIFGASGALPVFGLERWWTVLSAGWLHANALHIFMNMMAMRQLAYGVADVMGPGRMVIVYTAGTIGGFMLSSIMGAFLPGVPLIGGAYTTVGASASIAGLIGAILAYGHRSGSSLARSYANYYIVMLLFMGFMPFLRVDNWAHGGGFAAGYLVTKILDPLKPERIDHIFMGIVCLGLSVLSVLWSIVSVYLALRAVS